MNKGDIAELLSSKMGFSKRDCYEFVDSFFEIIREGILKGGKVKLSGFGNFIVKTRKGKRWLNPIKGEEVIIKPRKKLSFKPSPLLKKYINFDEEIEFNEWRKKVLQNR